MANKPRLPTKLSPNPPFSDGDGAAARCRR
jgi:hypothetical protein